MKTIRRHDRRGWYLLGVMFVAVFLFVFLRGASRGSEMDVDAASLANFDPGYIISDWQMGNYTSMSEAEIQAFLTSKNSCPNTSHSDYVWLKNNSVATWHFKDGHFVCLSEELFGDGEVIGSGETAAHIIWQAAQDYKINPQVIIVLLQKETSLITDPIPNNYDYRKAVGYGCPDTAPCSEKYYGLKNQIRHAAALFRTVLDGGWTNYPLGSNYVQYHPDRDCGGTYVNIRSLATSALYRYTPYQPDSASLAAGYGTAEYCSSYGNRNFYLYFQDWFGGITGEGFVPLDTPRYMVATQDVRRINPDTGNESEESIITSGQIIYYTTKLIYNNETCLRTDHNTKNNIRACVPMKFLKEVKYELKDIEDEYMIVEGGGEKTNLRTGKTIMTVDGLTIRKCVGMIEFLGKEYYITEFDASNGLENIENGFSKEVLANEYVGYKIYKREQQAVVLSETVKRNLSDNKDTDVKLKKGQFLKIYGEVIYNKEKYYFTQYDVANNIFWGISEKVLAFYEDLEADQTMTLTEDTIRIEPVTGEYYDELSSGRTIVFSSKIIINNKTYYRTKHNTEHDMNIVIDAKSVKKTN